MEREHIMRARHWLTVLVLSVAAAAGALGQVQEDPHERGFHPDKLYQFDNIDSVDLSSGSLGLTIPIGPRYPAGGGLSYGLTLTYSSNVWDFEERIGQILCGNMIDQYCAITYKKATPNIVSNAGMSWLLSLGWLGDPDTPDNPLWAPPTSSSRPTARSTSSTGPLHRSDASQLHHRRDLTPTPTPTMAATCG